MRLNLPRRTKKRVPDRERQPLDLAHNINDCWALDFMHDSLYCGRTFRTLNVIDEANRECLAIDIGTSIPSARLIRTLERLIDYYGKPQAIRLDNVLKAIGKITKTQATPWLHMTVKKCSAPALLSP